MRTISRRDLSHQSAKILDQILDTGEPVEVVTRGRPSLIISPKPEMVQPPTLDDILSATPVSDTWARELEARRAEEHA